MAYIMTVAKLWTCVASLLRIRRLNSLQSIAKGSVPVCLSSIYKASHSLGTLCINLTLTIWDLHLCKKSFIFIGFYDDLLPPEYSCKATQQAWQHWIIVETMSDMMLRYEYKK